MTDPAATPATADLATRYARQFDAVVGASGHTVSSPLGAWLLVALAAPLTTGAERAAIEAVLGTTADDAHARAEDLLGHRHDAVAHAVAVWHREEFVRPAFTEWSESLRDVETGPVPSAKKADRWAAKHTRDLVEHFPVTIDGATAIVLASALATKVEWTVPFDVTAARLLALDWSVEPAPGSWATQVPDALRTPDEGHAVHVFDTPSAGRVGVHAAIAREGLLVVSVIAEPAIARAEVRAAVHDVAAALVGASSTASPVAVADLPLGRGHAWLVEEAEVDTDRDPRAERTWAVLPAWACTVDHDLVATGAPGVPEILTTLARLTDDSTGPPDVRAGQGAAAQFTARGFEAAAVTALAAARAGAPIPQRTHRQRRLGVGFDRPYAVVAVAVARDDAAPTPSDARGWHGVPVFSAWVEQPAEAGE